VVKTNYRSFATTKIGVSHTKNGKVCQDCSADSSNGDLKIVAVSDGHGESNCFRSDRGAKFAVSCAIEAITSFVAACPAPQPMGDRAERETLQEMIGALVKSIVTSWQGKAAQDYENNPFSEEELAQCDEKRRAKFQKGQERHKAYGATLIAAAIAKNYWFGFQIGDGRWTALHKEGFAQNVPWDERCFLNVTTSICDFDANDRPRVYCELTAQKEPPIAIFLCSDGIDDNYPVEENEKYLYKLYSQIAIAFADDGFESTFEQISELCDSFAKKGKGDDTSLAGIVDMKRVKEAARILRSQLEIEEMALEAKKAQEKQAAIEAEKAAKDLEAKRAIEAEQKEKQESASAKNADQNANIASEVVKLTSETRKKAADAYGVFAIKITKTIVVFALIMIAVFTAYITFSDRAPQANAIEPSAETQEVKGALDGGDQNDAQSDQSEINDQESENSQSDDSDETSSVPETRKSHTYKRTEK
jgi:serine/threonine protein phosphatase PrpC